MTTPKRRTSSPNTLAPYVDRYLADRRKTGRMAGTTAKNVRYFLDSVAEQFGARPINQFTTAWVEGWLQGLAHLAPGTRRTHFGRLRSFARWLVEHDHVRKDPTARIGRLPVPRRVPRALSSDKAGTVVESAPDTRLAAILALMLSCGLRCIEVSRLQVGDYDPHAKTLHVHGKGGHERVLPVPAEARAAIDRYLCQEGAPQGPLIRSEQRPTQGLSSGYLSHLVSDAMSAAGIKVRPGDGVSAHALRHTAATDVLNQCHDVRLVQQMLGHANLATTTVYLGTADLGQLRAAMEGRMYRSRGGVSAVAAAAVEEAALPAGLPLREPEPEPEPADVDTITAATEVELPETGLLRSEQVAGLFGVTPRAVVTWASTGALPSFRTVGGHLRFRPSDVTRLMEAGRASAALDVPPPRAVVKSAAVVPRPHGAASALDAAAAR